jgi:hypothetical protein
MSFGIQQQIWNCTSSHIWTCPNASTPVRNDLDIDWYAVYSPSKI